MTFLGSLAGAAALLLQRTEAAPILLMISVHGSFEIIERVLTEY